MAGPVKMYPAGVGQGVSAIPVLVSILVSAAPDATDALARLHAAGIGVASCSLGQPTLDEVFLSLTGGGTAREVSV